MSAAVDRKYYQVAPAGSLAARVMLAARARIVQDLMQHMRPAPSDRVLDVGVSDVVFDGTNLLESVYPYKSNIVACGIGDGSKFQATFPETRYIQIEPNAPLPFQDETFEIATANAVLEHMGSVQNQMFLVSELCRVASRVFISVPNRFFPIEHHTALPFAHYEERLWRTLCRITGKSEWADERNLIFMTPKRLEQLAAPIKKSATIGYTGLPLGRFSSNLYLAFK